MKKSKPTIKTFLSFSFGCRVNQAEKEEIDRQLFSAGFSYDDRNPSFYIINTCAVTKKAEREARQFINQVRKKYPKTKIVITGCAATKWLGTKKTINQAFMLINNDEKNYIADILLKKSLLTYRSKLKNQSAKPSLKPKTVNSLDFSLGFDLLSFDSYFSKYLPSKRLLLKIQDGCQRFCTYCIVPYLRGKPQSVRIKDLEARIKDCEKEIKEVILTAINTEAYGLETGESFTDLIQAILTKTKIERLSFGSINLGSINKEFINLYKQIASDHRLIDYFHIPLQSGSNKILKLMKRDYTREEFLEKINALIKINPFAFLATDVIVGFLEETIQDFEDTYNFLADSPISKFHIFRFSKREKTAAYFMAKNLKEPQEETKTKRAKILAELGRNKYEKFLIKNLGRISSALFLERKTGDFQEALLDNQIPVLIKTNKNLMGEIKQVKIEAYKNNHLFGKII